MDDNRPDGDGTQVTPLAASLYYARVFGLVAAGVLERQALKAMQPKAEEGGGPTRRRGGGAGRTTTAQSLVAATRGRGRRRQRYFRATLVTLRIASIQPA